MSLPLWLVVVLVALAAWSALDRLLVPSVRWVLRRRVNHAIEEVNARLRITIPHFQLTKRQVLIDRLLYDPQVLSAVEAHAKEQAMPREVAMATVERYAREIVPSFNAYAYFRLGYALARGAARLLYRVRLGHVDEEKLAQIPRDSTVVFLMNHRSNMDYVLVAYLVADRTALSYAVGEWARIWPLQQLIRSMGAYFVRRNSKDALYRRVLERYVQMATAAGVPQAVYPEGGLTRDGKLRPPKLGILEYMMRGFDPHGSRDLIFIPVGINYDRVLEDRSLLLDADRGTAGSTGEPRAQDSGGALGNTLRFVARNLWQMARQKWHRFGYACVNLGPPFSTRAWLEQQAADHRPLDVRAMTREQRAPHVEKLAQQLMIEIGRAIPILPAVLVATVLLDSDEPQSELEIKSAAQRLLEELRKLGARAYVPRGDLDYAIGFGLRMLTLRRLVTVEDGLYRAVPNEQLVLRYYANSIAHLRTDTPRADLPAST